MTTIGFVCAALVAAFAMSQFVLANDWNGLGLIAIGLAGLALLIRILNNWRHGLYIFVGWLFFEDFVRKYLGNNMAIYFAKDILAILVYLSFLRARRTGSVEGFRIPFREPLIFFFFLCLVQMFNTGSPSIFYGVLGMKINFLYVPLMYVGYAFIRSEEDLQRLLSFVSCLILIVAGLGLAQSVIGPSFLNPANLQEDIRDLSTLYRVSASGLLAYRPTSVFVSSGRFQDFLIVSWTFSLGYAAYLMLRSRQGRVLAFATVGVVAAASIMSASRGVFMWNAGTSLLMTAGILWGAPWRQHEAIRILRTIQRATLFAGAAIVLLVVLFPDALGARLAIYAETLLPSSPTSELIHRTQTYPLQQLSYAFANPRWPYGNGTGTCSLGSQYVIRILGVPPPPGGVESGFGNLVAELGILGLVLWIVLGISIAISAWRVVAELRGTPWFPLAAAIFLYAVTLFFPMMFGGNSAYQDFLVNACFWMLIGILYRLKLFPKILQSVRVPEVLARTESHALAAPSAPVGVLPLR